VVLKPGFDVPDRVRMHRDMFMTCSSDICVPYL